MFETLRREWVHLTSYERFEQIVSRILLVIISLIIVYTLVLATVELVRDFRLGPDFLDAEVLQDAFGSLLTVLILLEFNHSIAMSVRMRSGVIQVRVVVLIAILVIARKLILFDYKSVHLETLAGLGGLALALGVLYWLLSDGERRRHGADPSSETSDTRR